MIASSANGDKPFAYKRNETISKYLEINKRKEDTDSANEIEGAASGGGDDLLTSLVLDGGQALLTEGGKPIVDGVRNIKARIEHFIDDAQWDQTLRQNSKNSFRG